MDLLSISTLGELKKSGYQTKPVKDELRNNLICFLQKHQNPFEGIIGYEDSVIPGIQTAVLSRHNVLLLGLRGQAKSRIARLFKNLLDEYIPVVKDSEINDDPFNPLSKYAVDMIAEEGDKTPISWLHRSNRYSEKLATPDVTVADLIGDVDPIKAATLKLPYSDERVIHFGIIPRSHRGIFVINEIPDLQARIQVALFNLLQETDIQIRGFKVRLPLDIQFIFTANPEDYTNRGAIVTPLKDRIDSQILTHYPRDLSSSKKITRQEARLSDVQKVKVLSHPLVEDLIEQVAFAARESEFIDQKSGVSVRLTISAYENIYSTAERRAVLNGEAKTLMRISDIYGIIQSITGKIELVYEGEQEGPAKVAQILIGKALRTLFESYFPSPDLIKKNQRENPYTKIVTWFNKGNSIDLLNSMTNKKYMETLNEVEGLNEVVNKFMPKLGSKETLLFMEFVLHGLAEYSLISKFRLEHGMQFRDMLSSMFTLSSEEEDDNLDQNFYK